MDDANWGEADRMPGEGDRDCKDCGARLADDEERRCAGCHGEFMVGRVPARRAA
jgi:hypothetical protein